MIETISFQSKLRVSNRGRPGSITAGNQLLIMLMYYREYLTFFHISVAYGISEAQCWRIVRKLETMLLKSSLFHLPGKKELTQNHTSWEVVVLDVGESPIERPKTAKVLFRQKEATHTKNTNCNRQENQKNNMYRIGQRQGT